MKRFYRTLCLICLIATVGCIPCAMFMTTWRFGLYFFAALCICTALMCKLLAWRDTQTGVKQRISKWLVRIGHVLFLVWLCSFVGIEGMIVSGTRSEVQQPIDVLCVLGGGLRGDQPSQNLKNRLVVAMDVMKQNPEAQVIVCGGQGARRSGARSDGHAPLDGAARRRFQPHRTGRPVAQHGTKHRKCHENL